MSIEQINLGTYANDGQGDNLRHAFEIVNSNFSQLDNIVAVDGINLGTGSQIFASKISDPGIGDKLTFRTIVAGSNLNISSDTQTITLNVPNVLHSVAEDTNPQLGGNLVLNSRDITGSGNITITGNITATQFIGTVNNANTVTNGVYTTSSINALADVDTASFPPTLGQALVWNGTHWAAGDVTSGGGGIPLDFGTFVQVGGIPLDLGSF